MKQPILLSWVAAIAIFSLFAFVAAAYYQLVVLSIGLVWLTMYFSKLKETRKILVSSSLLGVFAGLLVNLFFWTDRGISGAGAIVIVIPFFIYISRNIYKAYFLERGENNRKQ